MVDWVGLGWAEFGVVLGGAWLPVGVLSEGGYPCGDHRKKTGTCSVASGVSAALSWYAGVAT